MLHKVFVLFILSTVSSFSYAQNCPAPAQKYDIEILMKPLSVDYSKTSAQIRLIRGESQNTLLGLYSSQRKIEINPLAQSIRPPGATNYCAAITQAKVRVILEPIIYVAREAQTYACTKKRVEQHELMHHQFEIGANQQAYAYIEQVLRKNFSTTFETSSREHLSAIVKGKNQAIIREVQAYFSNATIHKHGAIDNPQNYENESRYCSLQENIAVMKMIRGY